MKKVITKFKGKRIAIIFKSDKEQNYIKKKKERSKEIIPKMKQRRLRAIILEGAKKIKRRILKKGKLDSTIIISHFVDTNYIFAFCNYT